MASYTIAAHIGTRDQPATEILVEVQRIAAAFPYVRVEKIEVTPDEMVALRTLASPHCQPLVDLGVLDNLQFRVLGVPVVVRS